MEEDGLEARRRRSQRLGNPLARRIQAVGKETYNKGLGKQQGTTRTIFDTIPLTGAPNVFNFFENLANKGFPWTNLNRNSFTDAEAMNIQRAYLSLIVTNNDTDYALLAANTMATFSIFEKASDYAYATPQTNAFAKLQLGMASIYVSGQQILKNFSFLSADPRFNKINPSISITSWFDTDATIGHRAAVGKEVYEFASPAVIPPNREFIVTLQVPPYVDPSTEGANWYLRLTLEGFGAIPSVEGTL